MSIKSDSGSEEPAPNGSGPVARSVNGEHYDEDVCRDYMRNVCTRGKRCRYRHPALEDRPEPPPRRDLTFCHDYQNNGCNRPSCKFLHCSRDEEEYFHRTGLLPSRLNYSKTPNGGCTSASANASNNAIKAELPVCRDFLNGECKRGSKCKFRHVHNDYENEKSSNDDRRNDRCYDHHLEPKRRRMEDEYDPGGRGLSHSLLEEENTMLRRKVEELKKQVSDLTAINEVLLEQNARYRVSKAANVMQVSQTLPAMALGVGATAAAHGQATMVVSPSLTQQVALNSDLATQHAMQAAQQQARLTATPLPAIAPVAQAAQPQQTGQAPTATITQNLAGALGLTQTNMAVSMATMAPTQLQVAHSLTQNLGAPPTSLVSYPIMSQNMRSSVATSSLTH